MAWKVVYTTEHYRYEQNADTGQRKAVPVGWSTSGRVLPDTGWLNQMSSFKGHRRFGVYYSAVHRKRDVVPVGSRDKQTGA